MYNNGNEVIRSLSGHIKKLHALFCRSTHFNQMEAEKKIAEILSRQNVKMDFPS